VNSQEVKNVESGSIAFAEKVMILLQTGSFNTTYKYAVLIAFMDLCIEGDIKKDATFEITTRQLAKKVLDIYWQQTNEFESIKCFEETIYGEQKRDFKINLSVPLAGKSGQAKIFSDILNFKQTSNYTTLFKAEKKEEKKYEELVNKIERMLIKMPLPRLQRFGKKLDAFIYKINWDEKTLDSRELTKYLKKQPSTFDNKIVLKNGVAAYFRSLNGLLRPLIMVQWTQEVSRMNKFEESKLHDFLFTDQRKIISQLAKPLRELQKNKCFLCDKSMSSKVHVDHFIPRARVPNDSLGNLVATHDKCNASKSDHLVAFELLAKWINRNTIEFNELKKISLEKIWAVDVEKSIQIAKNIYTGLAIDHEYWSRLNTFVTEKNTADSLFSS
jgi:hypothetical protein